MSGQAVVQLLGPAPNLWIAAGQTRTLFLLDPAMLPDGELSLMQYADVIALPEKTGQGGQRLSVTTSVQNVLQPVTSGPQPAVVRRVRYEVQNLGPSCFFNRTAILASFAATP